MTCPSCRAPNDRTAEVCGSCGQRLRTRLGPGSVVAGRYEILSQIGVGGMGTVLKARDRTLDLEVALKVVRGGADPDPDRDLVDRFRREVKLAWKVRHRNVCGIHEYGEDADVLYISMELVEGLDLKHLLRERGTPVWEEAYDIVLQAAEGLQAIHDAGVIHRDLKTANIMRDDRGVVRVMDFGIAKVRDESSGLTGTGQVVGSPEYMSPEQVRGRQLDFRSDIYAFGVVVYEVFTGRVPFRADTPVHTMLRHLETPPPLEGPEASQIPAALVPVLRTALAKLPEERYPSCREMLAALREARAALAAQDTDSLTHGASGANTGNTPTRMVRREAASGTSGLRASQARLLVPPLLKGLRHADKDVRARSAQALGRMGPAAQPARESLVAALADPDPEVRREAALALDAIGPDVRVEPSPLPEAAVAPEAPPLLAAITSGSEAGPSSTSGAIGDVRARTADTEGVPAAAGTPEPSPEPPRPSSPGRVWPREDAVPAITPFRGTRLEDTASDHPRGRDGLAHPAPRSTPKPGRPWALRPWVLAATILVLVLGGYALLRVRLPPVDRGVGGEQDHDGAAPTPPPVSTLEGTDPSPPVNEPPPLATTPPGVPSPNPPVTRPSKPAPRPNATLVPQPLPTPSEPATPEPTPMTAPATLPTPPVSTLPPPTVPPTPAPISPPECERCPQVPYPDLALQLGTEGTVTLRVEIDTTGRAVSASVTDVKITRGSADGASSLKDGATRAILRSWRFRPAQQAGERVNGTITITVRFTRSAR